MTLEDHYHDDVPYHNNKHAADVTQSMHVLLNSTALEVRHNNLFLITTLFGKKIRERLRDMIGVY